MKTPTHVPSDTLRALRDAHAARAADAALRSGDVSAEEIEKLERLSRLVELEESQRPSLRARLPLVIVGAVTLVAVSALLFARVGSTEIELDVEVSRVSFALSSRQALTGVLAVSKLGVGGLREARIPRGPKSEPQVVRSDEGDVALQVQPAAVTEPRGSVNLDGVILPAATIISVSHAGAARDYRVELGGATPDFRISLLGPTDISVSGVGRRTIDFDVPSEMLLQSAKSGLFLDLAFPEAGESSLARQLLVRDLSLQDVDETADADRTLVRRVSTIQSGTLYMEALDGQERKLRAGEMIHFEQSEGELRSTRFDADRIVLNFQGTVRGMTKGRGGNQINLMPTWLEWLQARHGLSLFWGSALYVFGLITALLRWFGGRE